MKKSKRSKACDISPEVRQTVGERDSFSCIFCHRPGIPNMHFIARSAGGLGIEENIACGCLECHNDYDNGKNHQILKDRFRGYLRSIYGQGWNEKNLYYNK